MTDRNISISGLRRRVLALIFALLLVAAALTTVTAAWYVYNTGRYTTNVKMAAGAGTSIRIANSYNGEYSASVVLDEFSGKLNPVSTNSIQGGFRKVAGFTNGKENQPNLVANLFHQADASDYYKTSLFLQTNAAESKVYISNIGFQDSDARKPISTAIRVGLVVHKAGKNMPAAAEYIWEINSASNPNREYNTATGENGYVLDSSKEDGTTVRFSQLTGANYCTYNESTGETVVNANSVSICTLKGGNGSFGEAVQIDVYIWLEGCDEDCTQSLCAQTLKNLALHFAAAA